MRLSIILLAAIPTFVQAENADQFNLKCHYLSHSIEGKNSTGGKIEVWHDDSEYETVIDIGKMESCGIISCPGGVNKIVRKENNRLVISESPIYAYADDLGNFTSNSTFFDLDTNQMIFETNYYKNPKGKKKGKSVEIDTCVRLPYNKPPPLGSDLIN